MRRGPSLGEPTSAGAGNSQVTLHAAEEIDGRIGYSYPDFAEEGFSGMKEADYTRFISRDARRSLKLAKRAAKCLKKLKTKTGATYQQKQSWKYHIAQAMKHAPTRAEEILGESLRSNKLQAVAQRQIGPYIVDFSILHKKLVIEVDGLTHLRTVQYDLARDRFLRNKGLTVLRFKNEEVFTDVNAVVKKILDAMADEG